MFFYKKEHLNCHKLEFKEGILHEDELFTFLVFETDGITAHCHQKLFNRRIRPGSIMTSDNSRRKFESMLAVFNDLYMKYDISFPAGGAADLYMIRIAKSVIGKYFQLSLCDQKSEKAKMYLFKRKIMKKKAYGDMKLKIKCSNPVMSRIYRLENKIRTIDIGGVNT